MNEYSVTKKNGMQQKNYSLIERFKPVKGIENQKVRSKHMKIKAKPEPRVPIDKILLPFEKYLSKESSSGILLIIFTIIALIWANSPWYHSYHQLWETQLGFSFGGFELSKTLHHWINDGLMSIFFFVVGLEIKREFLVGELSNPKKAMLPIAAAIGGIAAPALFYVAFNLGTDSLHGWAIPTATDIAFAIGVLTLLGKRVPYSIKVFLTALAIVDDIAAVLIIAIFYTSELSLLSLSFGFGFFSLMVLVNRLGVRSPTVYALIGAIVWVAFLKSGIHATVAGVLAAFAIPVKTRINPKDYFDKVTGFLNHFCFTENNNKKDLLSESQRSTIKEVEDYCEYVQSPLQRLEESLHPWVAFAIMPIFALANAGVTISGDILAALTHPVVIGIILGLVLGKQIGIMLASWLCIKTGIGAKPEGSTWRQIYGTCCIAGMGFTMSLFIANLAFPGHPELLDYAKIGILFASIIAGIWGAIVLMTCPKVYRNDEKHVTEML